MNDTTLLAEKVFGKGFSKITLEDFTSFFSIEQEESSILEFKEGTVGIEKIYKEVCAFLNTEGGVLLIGSPRETEDTQTKKKICCGSIVPSNYRGSDWLIQKIAGNISPSPTNIKIREFSTKGGSCFILNVPQSITPPHQSNDGRYYIRLETEAKPAPHGIVEALFFKRQKSILKINATFSSLEENLKKIRITISNESNFPAEKISYSVALKNVKSIRYNEFIKDNKTFTLNESLNQVLWKGLNASFNFEIETFEKPLFMVATVWGIDSEINRVFGIFDPVKNKMLKKTSDYNGENALEEIITHYHELVNDKY